MGQLGQDARTFAIAKIKEEEHARQLVALRLTCGIGLSDAFGAGPEQRARLIRRLERLIERERLKGMRRHWSYDLNRHIALKQVLDQLRGQEGPQPPARTKRQGLSVVLPANENGARRRRHR